MRRGKELIATDIDEVIFPFVEQFIEWHNREYGTSLTAEDFHTYEFGDVIDEPISEIVHRVELFVNQEHSHIDVAPIESAQAVIQEMSDDFDFLGLTARHPDFRITTKQYIEHYFRSLIPEIVLVGHKETVSIVRSKVDVCRSFGAAALVDDSIHHTAECADTKVQGILFGEYPWNRGAETPQGVIRCANWREVQEYAYSTAAW